jgi:dihydrofolate reductase
LKSLQWNNSSVLGGDIISAITALKVQPGHDLQIIGSGNLIQTLQAASLIDEYNVWTYPVVLGRGKRLFENGARAMCTATRGFEGFNNWRCDEHLCSSRRYSAWLA